MGVVVVATVVSLSSGINLSAGVRDDPRHRRVIVPLLVSSLFLSWLVPWLDRRGVWAVDGDVARWLGIAILLSGAVLRVWPMFVLGRRFSGLVAIQRDHELVTTGPYRHIRHPSYLGAVLGMIGFALVFRSGVGLVLLVPGALLLHARMNAEEALLSEAFGPAYAAYRRRTWRLVPRLY